MLRKGTSALSANGQVDLTPRQQEVVRYVAEDLTAKEIAANLNISTKTAEFHLASIRERLGVHGQIGIVRWAIRTGLIRA